MSALRVLNEPVRVRIDGWLVENSPEREMKELYEERSSRGQLECVSASVSSVDDMGFLGTPDEGMKEEGDKVEMETRSWSGSLCRGVWYGLKAVRSCAVASAPEALAIAV